MIIDLEQIIKEINDEIKMRERLKRVMKESLAQGTRITQRDVGKDVGCSHATISRWLADLRDLGDNNKINMLIYIETKEKELGIEDVQE